MADLSCHLEVTKCFQMNTYINTMGLAAFCKPKERHTRRQSTSASELLRCVVNTDTRRLGKITGRPVPFTPTTQAYRTALWPVVRVLDGCNSTSGRALLLFYLSPGRDKNTFFFATPQLNQRQQSAHTAK